MRPHFGGGVRRAAALALLVLVAPAAALAALPDWAKAVVASDIPQWHPEKKAVILLDYVQIRFVAAERSRSNPGPLLESALDVHAVVRGAVRVRGDSERALEYAALPYEPDAARILSARAWVVQPGGRKTVSYGRGDFVDTVAVFSNYVWDRRRVLHFVSSDKLEEGATLLWEFEVETKDAFAEFGKPFTQRFDSFLTEFEAVPAPGMRIEFEARDARLRSPVASTEPGSLKWELSRESAPPQRQPTAFFPNPRTVSVRCVPAAGSYRSTWEEVSSKVAEIIEPRVDPKGAEVTAQVSAILAGKVGRWERIRALSEFVQASVVYLEITDDRDILAGMRPHPPGEVLRNRYGDCKDKATLLVSMLRSSGVDAFIALVSVGDPLAVSEGWPSPNFNHAIVLIRADGSEPASWPSVDTADGRCIAFDPTDPTTPLGVLPAHDGGGLGLVVSPAGGKLVRMPVADPSTSRIKVSIEAVMGADGILKAEVAEDCFGQTAALHYSARHSKSREQYRDFLEGRVHRANPLCRDLHWSDNWNPSGAQYHLDMDFTVAPFGRAMPNGLILLSPDILPPESKLEPWGQDNEGVVVMGPDSVDEVVELSIPDGYAVEEVPDGLTRQGPLLSAEVTFKAEAHRVEMRKTLMRNAGSFNRVDYEQLRVLYKEVHEAERGSVILRKVPTGASAAGS